MYVRKSRKFSSQKYIIHFINVVYSIFEFILCSGILTELWCGLRPSLTCRMSE